MALLGRFTLRTKLFGLLACSALAVIVSIGAGGTIMRARMLADRADKLKAVIDSAVAVSQSLEQQVIAHKITREQAMERLGDVARAVRFDGGEGYLVVRKDGLTLFDGGDPKRENTRSPTKLPDGRLLIDAFEDALKGREAASFEYSFPKPGSTRPQPKIAYIGRFQPWGIVFQSGAYADDLDREFLTSVGSLALLGSAIMIATMIVAFLVNRDISGAISRLQQTLQRVARRDVDGLVADQDRRDEIGGMAASVQTLKDALAEQAALEVNAASATARADAERSQIEAERAETAIKQTCVMTGLGAGLARLSEGDLTAPIAESFAAEYDQLRQDYNAALDSMRAAITEIVSSAFELRSSSQEITQAADDLSRRTEQQAASLQETSSTMGQITAAVRQTAQGVEHARDSVASARAVTNRSGDIVRKAAAAMGEIERSANQISQIIGVIDEIAFQTKLLALNAGVEAARAGEAGRGFAVVASEVRALAQRCGEAAREIKSLISTSTEQVGRGVALVDETGRALAEIAVQVTEIDAVVGQIAVSAQEQATGLGEVNAAIGAMDEVTQQNAAMVEQSTAASHSLVEQSGKLVVLTKRFRVGRADPIARTQAPAPKGAKSDAACDRNDLRQRQQRH